MKLYNNDTPGFSSRSERSLEICEWTVLGRDTSCRSPTGRGGRVILVLVIAQRSGDFDLLGSPRENT